MKNQNRNLENLALKREEERKNWESKCKDLSDKNDNLMKEVRGQLPILGDKHVIWDVLIAESAKLMPYLDYILDKEIVMQSAKKSVTAVKER